MNSRIKKTTRNRIIFFFLENNNIMTFYYIFTYFKRPKKSKFQIVKMDVVYPPTPTSLYNALESIHMDKMRQYHVSNTQTMHIHAPNGLERLYLSRNQDAACRIGGSSKHCANATAELEMHRAITNREISEIIPAHAQLPSHIHVMPNVVNSTNVAFNKQLSLEAVHADFKKRYPQSYGFFTAPWTVRQQVCSGVDCRNNTDMIADAPIHKDCGNVRSAKRKF